jgi:hypothetical protein
MCLRLPLVVSSGLVVDQGVPGSVAGKALALSWDQQLARR